MWRARRGPALLSAPAPPPPRAAVHDARPHPAPRRRRDVFPGKLLLEPCKALLHLLGLPENPLHILHSASSVSSAPSSGSRSSDSAGWGIGALRGAGRASRTAAPSNSLRPSARSGSDNAFFSGPLPPPDDPSGAGLFFSGSRTSRTGTFFPTTFSPACPSTGHLSSFRTR